MTQAATYKDWIDWELNVAGMCEEPAQTFFQFLADVSVMKFNAAICETLGHDLYDNGSYANGETGFDQYACNRCGMEWSNTYY